MSKPRGLFINQEEAQCSIFESGKMIFSSLESSEAYKLDYLTVTETKHEVPDGYDFYAFNYHPGTMQWLDLEKIRALSGLKITFVLEVSLNDPFPLCSSTAFDIYCAIDPTMDCTDPRVFAFPRPLEQPPKLPRYVEKTKPTIGSFGLPHPGKGFELVVDALNREFDEAIFRLQIPNGTFTEAVTEPIHRQNYVDYLINLCRQIAKPGIEIQVSRDYLTKEELIKWCAENTLNCFLYDRFQPGLSATTDQAIICDRPLAISGNSTFRHIHSYLKPYPLISLKESIANSLPAVRQMRNDWSKDKFRERFEEVLIGSLAGRTPLRTLRQEQAQKKKSKLLLVNTADTNCGIYQFGVAMKQTLSKSSSLESFYVECSDASDFRINFEEIRPDLIIYNYYPYIMPWLNSSITKSIGVPQLGIMHEVTQQAADEATDELFDYHICPDPTLILNNPITFKVGRLIANYTNLRHLPDIPTIGGFGFGFPDKGFEYLVDQVQLEFDAAVIKLHMPFCGPVDPDGSNTSLLTAKRCQARLYKPDVKLEITHHFMDKPDLIDFLAAHHLNAFFYDQHKHLGISSAVEIGLAARRPIAISKSQMFRHLLDIHPTICIEETTLKQIIRNGIAPLVPFYNEWSETNYLKDFEDIASKATAEFNSSGTRQRTLETLVF